MKVEELRRKARKGIVVTPRRRKPGRMFEPDVQEIWDLLQVTAKSFIGKPMNRQGRDRLRSALIGVLQIGVNKGVLPPYSGSHLETLKVEGSDTTASRIVWPDGVEGFFESAKLKEGTEK